MAITWRGSTVTPQIQAMPPTNDNMVVFAIVNTFRSRCKATPLRIVCQYESTEPATFNVANRVMPIIRARRCAAADVSGGVTINARPAWDTTINSPDPGVKLLFNPGAYGGPDTNITAANCGGPEWQQFTMRMATLVGQVLTEDNSAIPAFAVTGAGGLLPGEALVFEQVAAIPTGGVVWFQIAWEEDQTDAGYQVAGTVNLSGSPVNGAKLLLVTDSTTGMTNPSVETLTTGAPGTYSKTLASGVKAAVFVQHEADGTKYSDEGKPFVEKL